MTEAYNKFMKKHGGYNKYQQTKKRWIGTVVCDKCKRKGRMYALIKVHNNNAQLQVMHFKGKNKDYDYVCNVGTIKKEELNKYSDSSH